MKDRGVKLIYGRWLIEGAPNVILFDTGSAYNRLDEWKGDLWNLAGIPTPPNDNETNETIVFGYLVAWFLGEVSWHIGSSARADKTVPQVLIPGFAACSLRRTTGLRPLSPISTNGKPDSPSPCAENVTSM